MLASIFMMLLGGFRAKVIVPPALCFCALFFQRQIRVPEIILGTLFSGALLMFFYFGDISKLPFGMQRALSVLPGMEKRVDFFAAKNAFDIEGARRLRQEMAWEIAQNSGFMGLGMIFVRDARGTATKELSADMARKQLILDKRVYSSGYLGHYITFGPFGVVLAVLISLTTWVLLFRAILIYRRHFGASSEVVRLLSAHFALFVSGQILFTRAGDVPYFLIHIIFPLFLAILFLKNLPYALREKEVRSGAKVPSPVILRNNREGA